METWEYLLETTIRFFIIVVAVLAVLETRIEESSAWRSRADRIYRFFGSERLIETPRRLIEKLQAKVLLFNKEIAASKAYLFILTIEALILVPIHSYRALPHPFPTWEFALNPYLYYFGAIIVMIAFLRSSVRILRSQPLSYDIYIAGAFLVLCGNVLMMDMTFLQTPKQELLTNEFNEPLALYGIDRLVGKKWAIAAFLFLVTFSAHMLSFFVVATILILPLRDYVSAGVARHVSTYTAALGLIYIGLYFFDPEVGITSPESLQFYITTTCILIVISASLLSLISLMQRRPAIATISLILLPHVGFAVLKWLLRDIGPAIFVVFAILFGPMVTTYFSALVSGLFSSSALIANCVFRSQKAAEKPFGALGALLSLIAAILYFVLKQAVYYTQ